MPGKKKSVEKARLEIRLPIDVKDLLKKRTEEEGYDYLSDFVRDKLIESIKGNQSIPGDTPIHFDFDDSSIVSEIQLNRSLLVQILHILEVSQQLQPVNNIIDSLISLIPLEDMKKCRNIDELRSLFPLESQKSYVYDLLNYLEKLKIVVIKEENEVERLFWLEV